MKSQKGGKHKTTEIPHFVSIFVDLWRLKVIKAYDKIWKLYEVQIWAEMHFQG